MALSTELLSKLQEWSGKRLLKTLGAIVAVGLTGITLYLSKDQTTRVMLLGVEVLALSFLWLSLQVNLLQKRLEKLEDAHNAPRPAQTMAATDLNELEFSLLCMLSDGQSETVSAFVKKFGRDKLEIRDALIGLAEKGLISEHLDSDYLGTGEWYSTREGREYVRKKRG
jgi:hypothetical protein